MEGNIIMDRDLKRSIILDNYQNPNMKHIDETIELHCAQIIFFEKTKKKTER